MDDLVAFVSARLDEDEVLARRVQVLVAAGWNYFDETPAELIDPDRTIREVAAGRRILARYQDCVARMENPDYSAVFARAQAREYEDFVLPNLATAWNGHPDYRPEWKP